METMPVITRNNETQKNITHLHPGTSIEMQVFAISVFGGLTAVGPVSERLVISTKFNASDPHHQGMCCYCKRSATARVNL